MYKIEASINKSDWDEWAIATSEEDAIKYFERVEYFGYYARISLDNTVLKESAVKKKMEYRFHYDGIGNSYTIARTPEYYSAIDEADKKNKKGNSYGKNPR